MKKLFLAMMAVAAIAFVGCKPQNEPDKDKDQKPADEVKVTLSDVKIYYDVKFTGKMADYVNLDLRYVEIPDSNEIMTKEHITADWMYDKYSVKKGSTVFFGIEPSVRVTELFKQTFTDEAKHKTMVESNSSLIIASNVEKILSDGTVLVDYGVRDSIILSNIVFDESKMDEEIKGVEYTFSAAHKLTWTDELGAAYESMDFFWDRH